jgi:SAM-dependent methyltransferase
VGIHRPFLDKIVAARPRRVLEAGCGSGIMSVHFSRLGIPTVAVDRDETVLAQARTNGEALGGRVEYRRGDIFHLEFPDDAFDVVFSQGVLEHFSDDDIRRAVAEELRVARTVWVSVPGYHYNHRDFGDERLLTRVAWERIVSPLGHVEAEEYYYVRVRRNFYLKRPLMLMLRVWRDRAPRRTVCPG